MPFEIEKWIEENLAGVPEADRAAVTKIVSQPAVVEKIKASTLRHSDYSRQADELRAERQRLEAEQTKAQKDYEARFAALADTEGKTKAELRTLKEELAAAQAELEAADEVLRKAKEEGYDVDLGLEPKPKRGRKAADPPPIDTSKFLTQEQLDQALAAQARKIGQAYGPYPIELLELTQIHGKMFEGQTPDLRKVWDAYQANPKKSIQEHWGEIYKVTERAAELDKLELEKIKTEAKAEGRREAIKEMTRIPDSPQPEHFQSPALKLAAKIQAEKAEKGQPFQRDMSHVERAARRAIELREQRLRGEKPANAA